MVRISPPRARKTEQPSSKYSKYVSNSRFLETSGPNEITEALDGIVLNAEQRIWIAVPWFYTEENPWITSFIEKLCEASRKGVDVRVFMRPDISNHVTVNRLHLAGAKVFSKKQILRYIHTKMMMNEGEVLTVTANITDTDLYRNLNSGTLTNQEEFLEMAAQDFERLLEPEIEMKYQTSETPIKEILPKDLVPFFQERYTHLNPMQKEAAPLVLRHRENLLIGAETGTGKTLLAELAAFNELQNPKAKILYTAPLKAITVEKEKEWNRFENLGCKVYKITGDEDTVDVDKAKEAQLILSTGEKWDSLTRKPHRYPFVKDLSLMVVDEIHILDDEDRGATTEALLSRVKRFNPKARILGLSATMKNVDTLARWLNGEAYLNKEYRPVPIHYAFCAYPDSTYINLMESAKDKICLDTVQMLLKEETGTGKPGKILIFTGSRAKAENAAKMIGENVQCPPELHRRSIRNGKLAYCLSKGTAFLHAGLSPADRKEILNAFNEGDINILAATTALAWGVNLAARSVIVRDIFIANKREVDIIGIKQMLGRAGRKGQESVGYGIILAPNSMKDQVQKMLIEGKDIESKMEKHILDHINAEIKLGYVENRNQLKDWFHSTFWYYQNKEKSADWKKFLDEKLSLLVTNGFVEEQKNTLKPTLLGRLTADWYVKVNTAIKLLAKTCDFDYQKQGSVDRIELSLIRLLAENAEELSMFIRSLEERAEITAFQTQNPMVADCAPEAVKICMIMLSAMNKSGRLDSEEYQAYKESTRLMGYLSELGRIKGNISLHVIARDLARRLQYHETRGAGQLLHLIWCSTPDNEFKDRTVKEIYDELQLEKYPDIRSLVSSLPARNGQSSVISSLLVENAARFPALEIQGIDGKHQGENLKLLIQSFEEPATVICRIVDATGEHWRSFEDCSAAYLSISGISRELVDRIGLNRLPLEVFALNRFGWDYAQAIMEIVVLPGSWRKQVMEQLEDYLEGLGTEVRPYSFLKELWLKIKRKGSYVRFGLDFAETSGPIRITAQILTQGTSTTSQKTSAIIYFVKKAISVIESPRFGSPMINLLKERTATYDEIAILTVSLLRSLDIECSLVEVRGGKTEKHYLPTYIENGDWFVVDYFDEIRNMNARVRAKTKIKMRSLAFRDDKQDVETNFALGWLEHYFSPLGHGQHKVATLRNYDGQDLKELRKYCVPEVTIRHRFKRTDAGAIAKEIPSSRRGVLQFDLIRREAKGIPWDGTVVDAAYYGRCPKCGNVIRPEDKITWWKPKEGETRWIHVECTQATRKKKSR